MLFEEKSRIRDKNILHFYSAWLMFWVCFLCNGECIGQEQEFTTFCNPINIDYQFNIDTTWFTGRNLWREAADPVIVTYKGDYYLFASKAGGYWYSNDLSTWTLVEPEGLPLRDYAPTAMVIDDRMYFTAMRSNRIIYSTDDPKKGIWQEVAEVGPYMLDPALFLDDDGKVYLYYYGAPNGPIYGVELDPNNGFQTVGKPFACLYGDYENRGWECRGDENLGVRRRNKLEINPWIEGAWMTKHKGTYYLQYAAPGTEFKSYADGVFTASKPTGPFVYAPYSPFSHKPTGFITAAGHGGMFQDKQGKYWKVATMFVGGASDVDRRVGIFPATFDEDGQLHADTYLGDYPQYLPRLRKNAGDHNLAGWMLLSYKKKARASSSRRSHQVENAVDEDIQTYWSAATGHKGEWLEIDLRKTCKICAIQVNFADNNVIAFGRKFYHQYQVEVSQDAENWELIVDKSNSRRDVPHDYFQLQKPVTGKFVRIKNVFSPGLGCFSIRDLRIFGDGFGRKPEAVNNFEVQRNPEDQRRTIVKWDKALRADGYIVRYGILPNKLYNNYQIYEGNEVAINSLNAGVDYYFKVDSFNDSGISYAASIKQAPAK